MWTGPSEAMGWFPHGGLKSKSHEEVALRTPPLSQEQQNSSPLPSHSAGTKGHRRMPEPVTQARFHDDLGGGLPGSAARCLAAHRSGIQNGSVCDPSDSPAALGAFQASHDSAHDRVLSCSVPLPQSCPSCV